jgi:hypothetical protein
MSDASGLVPSQSMDSPLAKRTGAVGAVSARGGDANPPFSTLHFRTIGSASPLEPRIENDAIPLLDCQLLYTLRRTIYICHIYPTQSVS